MEDIARRFGAIEFEINSNTHQEVVQNYLANSGDIYKAELENAKALIT